MEQCGASDVHVAPECSSADCKASILEPPIHKNRSHNASVFLIAWVSRAAPLDALRYVSYYFLLGVNRAMLLDNRCGANATLYDRALEPYTSTGRVEVVRDFRCKSFSYALQMNGRALVESRLRTNEMDLLIALDEDELLALSPPTYSLHDLHAEMIAQRVCAIFVLWRVFGSSGHTCLPPSGIVASYTQRIRVESEANASIMKEARNEAESRSLHKPYGWDAGWAWGGKAIFLHKVRPLKCGIHGCVGECNRKYLHNFSTCAQPPLARKHPWCRHVLEDVTRIPMEHDNLADVLSEAKAPTGFNESFRLRLHHYGFQSAAQWETKKVNNVVRNRAHAGAIPSRYDEIFDNSTIEEVKHRIRLFKKADARRYLHELLVGGARGLTSHGRPARWPRAQHD